MNSYVVITIILFMNQVAINAYLAIGPHVKLRKNEYNKEKGMNRLEIAIEWAELMEADLLLLGETDERMDYAEAFLGITNDDPPKAIYSEEKVLDVLVKRDGMSYEDAMDFFEFNIRGAYLGEQTPLYILSFEP